VIGQVIVSPLQASTELHAMMQTLLPCVQPPVHESGQRRPGGVKSSPQMKLPPVPAVLELAATELAAPPLPVVLDALTVMVPPDPPAPVVLPPALVVENTSGASPERSRPQPTTIAIARKVVRSIAFAMLEKGYVRSGKRESARAGGSAVERASETRAVVIVRAGDRGRRSCRGMARDPRSSR
jgi:hypothetical protein